MRRVSEQLFEMHPLSMSGGCSQGRVDEAPCEIDALLASVGARRRAVVSNDDCGWLALFGGRRSVALQLSEDAVTASGAGGLREEQAADREALPVVG